MRYIGQKSRKVKAVFRRRAEPICGTRQLAGVHRCSQRHPARGASLIILREEKVPHYISFCFFGIVLWIYGQRIYELYY